jgi:hypothetical protein
MLLTALSVVAIASLGVVSSASAELTGAFTKFQYCPRTNVEVKKCLYSVTESGEVKMGSKTVPIVNDVVLQGGYGAPNKETKISKFFAATEGKPTLQPVAQPVPGGLAGLVNCKLISNFILKAACEWTFENGVTGLNATLELAQPASAMEISESNMARREKVALKLPVKMRLENPLLGESCYVGSEGSPVIWNLTSGKTAPPPPNTSIEGASGVVSALEEGLVAHLTGNSLVDNAWAAPKAAGCGGIFSFILDPIINAAGGLPAAAGTNSATLNNLIDLASVAAVNLNDSEHP